MTWKSTGDLAREAGVTHQTIVNWIKRGKYERTQQTDGGHYRVWLAGSPRTHLYTRVSSRKQISSLDSQLRIIQEYDDFGEAEIVRDIGSGFNFERRGFKAILEYAMQGNPVRIVVATHDRLCRSAFQLIKYIIELHGGEIIIVEEDMEAEGFDTNQLIAFLTTFCNSHHGKRSKRSRSSKLRRKHDHIIKENQNLSKKLSSKTRTY